MRETTRRLIAWLEAAGRRPVVVASHPRSGTHLLIDALRLNFEPCSAAKRLIAPLHHLYFDLDRPDDRAFHLPTSPGRGCPRPLFKTHACGHFRAGPFDREGQSYDPELTSWLTRHATFLYVYRDGRDAICSTRAFMGGWNPAARVGCSGFLRQSVGGMSRPKFWAAHVQSWLDRSDAYCVAMEGLLRFPGVVLSGVAERLGLEPRRVPFRLARQPATLFGQRVTRIFSRRPQSTAILSPRAARQGWREAFDASDRQFFADETGDLLIRMGYEESPEWVRPDSDALDKHPAGFWKSCGAAAAASQIGKWP